MPCDILASGASGTRVLSKKITREDEELLLDDECELLLLLDEEWEEELLLLCDELELELLLDEDDELLDDLLDDEELDDSDDAELELQHMEEVWH